MKKSSYSILLASFAVFLAFTAGFFLSRATQSPIVQITKTYAQQTVTTTVPATIPHDAAVSPIDINTADQTQLTALPGIGDTIAARIITYREENGPFHDPHELIGVKGIGEKKLESILPYIIIGGSSDEDTGS